MTDAAIKELYARVIGEASEWTHKDLRATRRAVEAKSLDDAVEILRIAGWGEPTKCALALRGGKKCPTCKGSGFVE